MFMTCVHWLEQSEFGRFIRTAHNLYPTIESMHVVGIALLFGPTLAVDLRLLGFGRSKISVTTATKLLLPIAHVGFALVALTGFAMFSGIAVSVVTSAAGPWKFGLILLACLNVLIFHCGIYRSVSQWNVDVATPLLAKLAALASIFSWIGVVFAGRFLAY
jgi:hypothetical protein